MNVFGKELGLRLQVGRTRIDFHRWLPMRWEVETSLMAPNLYGFGLWVTRDHWKEKR